jgi:Zn finger protein HypA/HybF involved in hydrogenase expression
MSDTKVINLDDHRPHISGEARCLACKHEWVAAAPIGTDWLECPECGTLKGRFIRHCEPEEGIRWRCQCGNDLFQVYETGILCPNCGTPQSFP